MINKIYEQVKEYIIEFKWFFIVTLILAILPHIYLPYYIEAPGGLSNVANKLQVQDAYPSKGMFGMAYVNEYKANIPLYIYSYFNKDWDLVTIEEENNGEPEESVSIRSKLLMKSSISNAIIVAFSHAGEDYNIIDTKNYVTYISESSDTTLEVGDEIIEVYGHKINNLDDIATALKGLDTGTLVDVRVINSDLEEEIKSARLYEEDGKLLIGISVESLKEVTTDIEIKNNIKENEVGPSGGLLMSLSLYDSLTKDDLTNGLKIAGTGTITSDGVVGAIGGVEYKIKGAYKNKADLFLIPKDNYEEARKVVEENNYDLKLVSVSTFDDAIKYLESIK